MKNFLLAAIILTSTASFASEVKSSNCQAAIVINESVETPVKPEDLPEAVRKTLAGATYAEWKISSAFHVKDGDKEHYKINLAKGEEKQTVNLDKEGQIIK